MQGAGAAFHHAVMPEHGGNGAKKALHIQPKADVLYIPAIQLCFLGNFQLVAAMDLCPAGQPRAHSVCAVLIPLGQQVGGKIITNDYNLNKVAQLRGVEVLNINELSNAVKPVVIPGETMHVTIVKAGKEPGQGVAYLDDGTMIVVENGYHHMNESITVEVTSALQTAAGRMIFAKPAR